MELLLPTVTALERDDLLDLYDAPAPYLRAGMVTSLDGASAYAGGSRPLQSPGDGWVVGALRAVADAVLVGAGTARADAYRPIRLRPAAAAWRAVHGRPTTVPLVVVSRSLDLPSEAPWLAERPLVVTCAAAPEQRRARLAERADVLVCGGDTVDLPLARTRLADRGLTRLLCEGGPGLLGDVLRAGLLTEVCATVAPLLTGSGEPVRLGMVRGPLAGIEDLELVHLLRERDTLMGRWRLRPGDQPPRDRARR